MIRPLLEQAYVGHCIRNRLKGDKKEIRRPVKRLLR